MNFIKFARIIYLLVSLEECTCFNQVGFIAK